MNTIFFQPYNYTVAIMSFSQPSYSQNEVGSPLSVNLVLDAATSGTIAQEIVVQITASAQGDDTATGKKDVFH